MLEINPFDQPNVQEAKDNTKRVLDSGPPDLDPGDLQTLRAHGLDAVRTTLDDLEKELP